MSALIGSIVTNFKTFNFSPQTLKPLKTGKSQLKSKSETCNRTHLLQSSSEKPARVFSVFNSGVFSHGFFFWAHAWGGEILPPTERGEMGLLAISRGQAKTLGSSGVSINIGKLHFWGQAKNLGKHKHGETLFFGVSQKPGKKVFVGLPVIQ